MNRKILGILERDGRKTYAEIAAEMKRSESTVRDRIQRMERAGIILGYTAAIDRRSLGYQTEGLVLCNVDNSMDVHKVIEALAKIENVLQVFLVSGERRIALWIVAEDNRDLEEVLRRYVSPLGLRDVSLHIVTERQVGLCVKI